MSYKTQNFILSPLKSPIFLFYNHVTPKMLTEEVFGGNKIRNPEHMNTEPLNPYQI